MRKLAVAGAAIIALLAVSIQTQYVDAAAVTESLQCDRRATTTAPVYDPCLRPGNAISAKVAAAEIYDYYLRGVADESEVADADRLVERFTGVDLREPQRNVMAFENGTDPFTRYEPGQQKSGFEVFRQANSWYCGPATAQSILWYFAKQDPKYQTAATLNTKTNQFDHITGGEQDQAVLAGNFWLATEKYHGTNWGAKYMPFTLNAWRGDQWYTMQATPYLKGGNLTKDAFWKAVRYDTDRGFPIAVNSRYNSGTFLPAGFKPGIDYKHWDTVYGWFEMNGQRFLQQGQVFGSPGYDFQAYQNVTLDQQWAALGGWHGIVW